MALEQTKLLAKMLLLPLDAAAKIDASIGIDAMNTEDQTPAQCVHLAKLAMILNVQYQIVTNLAKEVAKTATPTELGPLLIAAGNAVQSIDQALQTLDIDMGLREEHLRL